MTRTYDHTDAAKSPLLRDAQADHRARVKAALRQVMTDHGEVLRRLSDIGLQRPSESTLFNTDPHTRIGY
jgi:hypothetical protein